MNSRAPDIADLGFKVSDHVCAFYNEGSNSLDDIVVDYVSNGLRARNKCACFTSARTASSVRDRIPGELMKPEGILQFFTQAEAFLAGGEFSKVAFQRDMEGLVKEALSGGYERCWVLADAAFIVRNSFSIDEWFAFEAEVNEFAPRYPWFGMCLYNLDRFDGELVMKVFQTHPRIFVNGMVIDNPYYVPTREFLASL